MTCLIRCLRVTTLLLAAAGLATCGPSPSDADATRPRLLVMVVVDQLGQELLTRYEGILRGGFRRLLDEGAYISQVEVPYAVSNSAPGHATLATGMEPRHHGIVDNGWMVPRGDGSWHYVGAVTDTTERVVGGEGGPGRSPRARLSSTLGDWAIATDPRARVLVVGQGPTSANDLAPSHGGQAYWFSAEAGGYVSSTYYVDSLPDWAARFDTEELPRLMAAGVPWTLAVPDSLRGLALPDDTPWEGDADARVFPHGPVGPNADPLDIAQAFASSPAVDEASLRLAEEGLRALALGQRESTDVLLINVSALDEAGHSFGPWSLEQLDALLELDRHLGRFMEVLDEVVGRDRWVLALTADHGAATPPEQAGAPATRVGLEEMARVWSELGALADRAGGPRTDEAVSYLESLPYVADVYTIAELRGGDVDEEGWLSLYRRSFREDRIPDFPFYDRTGRTSPAALGIGGIRLTEGTVPDFAVSVHGSPYPYDRRVPLMLLGAGTRAGVRLSGSARITDVAPTLAELGGLPVPEGLDGRSLADRVR